MMERYERLTALRCRVRPRRRHVPSVSRTSIGLSMVPKLGFAMNAQAWRIIFFSWRKNDLQPRINVKEKDVKALVEFMKKMLVDYSRQTGTPAQYLEYISKAATDELSIERMYQEAEKRAIESARMPENIRGTKDAVERALSEEEKKDTVQ
jgi:hypothetical protein